MQEIGVGIDAGQLGGLAQLVEERAATCVPRCEREP